MIPLALSLRGVSLSQHPKEAWWTQTYLHYFISDHGLPMPLRALSPSPFVEPKALHMLSNPSSTKLQHPQPWSPALLFPTPLPKNPLFKTVGIPKTMSTDGNSPAYPIWGHFMVACKAHHSSKQDYWSEEMTRNTKEDKTRFTLKNLNYWHI